MVKASILLGILMFWLGIEWFSRYGTDPIQPFLIYEFYIAFTLFSICNLSKELMLKSLCLYAGIFWSLDFITDLLGTDILMIITFFCSFPIYILCAKRIIKTPQIAKLDFKHNYILHMKPFKWYHWIWILVGKDMDAYRTYYNSHKQIYMRMEDGILVEIPVRREKILREISLLNADVSKAEVSYEELKKKLGAKINCKKEIY